MLYEKVTGIDGKEIVVKNEDSMISFIPMDESNSDYQQYLLWLEEQA